MTFRQFLTKRLSWAIGALAVAATAVALPRASSSANPGAARVARPLPVATVAVTAAPSHTERRFYTGEVRARRTAEIGFQVGGQLVGIDAPEGAEVEAGALLARLDTRRIENQQRAVEARLAEARARLDEMVAGPRVETIEAARANVRGLEEDVALAQIKTERRRELLSRDAVSAEESDEAEFRERSLDARLAAARAELEELERGTREEHLRAQRAHVERLEAELDAIGIELADSELRAPYAGTVAAHLQDAGAVLGLGQPVLRLVESGTLEAWVGLPPAAARDLRGDAELEIDGALVPVRLRSLLPELDPATRTRSAVFELDPHAAVPGQTVRLALETEVVGRGFWLPVGALVESTRGLWSCYAVVEDEHGTAVERRELELLHTEGARAFVRGTLYDGDLVVTRGVHRVVPGQAVTLAQPTPGAGPFGTPLAE